MGVVRFQRQRIYPDSVCGEHVHSAAVRLCVPLYERVALTLRHETNLVDVRADRPCDIGEAAVVAVLIVIGKIQPHHGLAVNGLRTADGR